MLLIVVPNLLIILLCSTNRADAGFWLVKSAPQKDTGPVQCKGTLCNRADHWILVGD